MPLYLYVTCVKLYKGPTCLIVQYSKHIVKLNYYSHPRNLFLDKRSFLSSSVRRSSTALTQNATEVQVVTSDRQAGPYVPPFPKISTGVPWVWLSLPLYLNPCGRVMFNMQKKRRTKRWKAEGIDYASGRIYISSISYPQLKSPSFQKILKL